MGETVEMAVGITKEGNIGWIMTRDFEERVWAELQHYTVDDELFDEIMAARKQAGLKKC